MSDRWILNENGDLEPCGSLHEWAEWFENSGDKRRIAQDLLPGDVRVSTVFLALDHSFGGATPILFETMIFGGAHDQFQERYTMRADAVAGHAKAVALARGGSF